MLDSLQLLPLIRGEGQATDPEPSARGEAERRPVILDLGSGAGFPGLVLAIAGAGQVHLVESDRKKASFLREVVRRTGAPAMIHNCRIEVLPPLAADVVTARALAPAAQLLSWAAPHLLAHAVCLFHKGRDAQGELTRLPREVQDRCELLASRTEPEARILRIRGPWK